MNKMLRILLIEDNPGDARLIEEMLKEATDFRFEVELADRLALGLDYLKHNPVDAVILDLGLPDSQGLSVLMKLNEIKPEVPVIVLTGLVDEAIGIQAVKEGAQDYLIKGQADKNQLARSIKYAIERKKAKEALHESEQAKTKLLVSLNEAQQVGKIGSCDMDWQTNNVWWSEETYRIFGITPQEFVPSFEANGKFIHPDDLEKYIKLFEHTLQSGELLNIDVRLVTNDGLVKPCNVRGKVICDDSGQPIRFIGTIMDITERKRAEEEKEKLINELKDALAKVKQLSGMLPICASCKKIRDDKGYWNQLEKYISEHSETQFSHGLCPECAKKAMKDFEEFVKDRKQGQREA